MEKLVKNIDSARPGLNEEGKVQTDIILENKLRSFQETGRIDTKENILYGRRQEHRTNGKILAATENRDDEA